MFKDLFLKDQWIRGLICEYVFHKVFVCNAWNRKLGLVNRIVTFGGATPLQNSDSLSCQYPLLCSALLAETKKLSCRSCPTRCEEDTETEISTVLLWAFLGLLPFPLPGNGRLPCNDSFFSNFPRISVRLAFLGSVGRRYWWHDSERSLLCDAFLSFRSQRCKIGLRFACGCEFGDSQLSSARECLSL